MQESDSTIYVRFTKTTIFRKIFCTILQDHKYDERVWLLVLSVPDSSKSPGWYALFLSDRQVHFLRKKFCLLLASRFFFMTYCSGRLIIPTSAKGKLEHWCCQCRPGRSRIALWGKLRFELALGEVRIWHFLQEKVRNHMSWIFPRRDWDSKLPWISSSPVTYTMREPWFVVVDGILC